MNEVNEMNETNDGMVQLTTMHNPPHPGEFISEVYLQPFGISARSFANQIGVAPSTVARLLSGMNRVSPEMALRLSKSLGRSAESWLSMQDNYDLWQARQHVNLEHLRPLELKSA